MPGDFVFRSSLIVFVRSSGVRTQTDRTLEAFQHREPVVGTRGFLEFESSHVSSELELFRKLEILLADESSKSVIVLSDQLTTINVHGGCQVSSQAQALRNAFLQSQHPCGLVAIVSGSAHRIPDIDRAVSAEDLAVAKLKKAIVETAAGLWMKSPPSVSGAAIEPIRVQAVRSEEEMRRCLALRFGVYSLMGYLPEDVSNCGAEIEMDSFDINAIHFIATNASSGETVGTARLVLQYVSPYMRDTVVGAPARTLVAQRGWCLNIAEGMSESALRDRLEHPYFAPLPILQSSDFKERWAAILDEAGNGGELSRVVVAPQYRGLGASRLLVRIVIATAFDLKKSFLLLECVPTHAKMYAQYGFTLLEGHHCRAQELDQIAVGMRLDFNDDPPNQACALAKRDVGMIKGGRFDPDQLFGSKFLCLCHLTSCWRDGAYESRATGKCPLRSSFVEDVASRQIGDE